jgi:hypothetical protein
VKSGNVSPSKGPAQRERILSLLRFRGAAGASNVELNAIAFRYGGRIHELRGMGYRIDTRRESENLFRFVLVSEPDKIQPLSDFEQRRRREEAERLPLFARGVA